MMSRDVMQRQMFANGGAALPMEQAGISSIMPEDQAIAFAEQNMDTEVLSQGVNAAAEALSGLENAEDYETVMNSLRGDEAPLEARYEELAGIVGEEDAAQTPESVLALVQPVIMMASVDQGIGELAAEQMTQPVDGAMAEGIMSTVAPPPQPAAPGPEMMGAGQTPPVNFNKGGLVRRGDNQPVQYFAKGGETLADFQKALGLTVTSPQNLTKASLQAGTYPVYEPTYDERVLSAAKGAEARYAAAGLGTPAERAAALEEQKRMTQAQMLFDIANTALAFSGPMEGERRGMSAAERLAMAAQQTKLLPTIGARAQQQLEYKKAADKEERALKLAAVQRGETQVDTEIAAEQALELARAKKKDKDPKPMVLLDKTGTKVLGQFNINDFTDYAAAKALRAKNPGSRLSGSGPEKPNTVTIEGQVIDITDMTSPKVIFGDKKRDTKTVNGQIVDYTDPDNVRVIFGTPDVKTVTVKGQVIDITKPESPKVIFGEKDPTIKIVEGQVVDLTDKNNPVVVFGDPKKDTAMVNGQLIDYTDSDNPKVIYGDKNTKTTTVNGEIIDITDPKNPTVIFGKPDRKTLTVEGQVIDITDPDNVKTIFGEKKRDIRVVNGQLVEIKDDKTIPIFGERTPKTGTFENMILKSGENILVKKVGETLYDVNGDPIDLSTGRYESAIIVSKDKAFETSRMAGSQAAAAEKLRLLNQEMGDSKLANQISKSDDILGVSGGANVSRRTFDALNSARKGVGLYNKFAQIFSEVGGAIVPALRNVAAEEVEAGYYMDAVNVLFRVALANSPRFAESEQQRLAKLSPSTEDFLTNPENAVRKLIGLKRLMNQEYKNNLSVLSRSTNASIRQQAEQQNYAIEGVLKMLETIPDRGFVDETVFESTMDEIMKRRAARGAEQ